MEPARPDQSSPCSSQLDSHSTRELFTQMRIKRLHSFLVIYSHSKWLSANFTFWKRQQKRKPHRSGYGARDAATFPQRAPRASSGPPGAMRRAGPDRPRRSLPLSPLRPGSPSRSASEPLGKQRAESCPGPRRSFSHPAGRMGLETEPLFQAWSYFRRRKFRQCSELCSQLLEGAPGEQVGGRAGPGGRGTGLSTCCCCRRNALRSTVREPVVGRAPAG